MLRSNISCLQIVHLIALLSDSARLRVSTKYIFAFTYGDILIHDIIGGVWVLIDELLRDMTHDSGLLKTCWAIEGAMAAKDVLVSIVIGILLIVPQTSSFGAFHAARAQQRSMSTCTGSSSAHSSRQRIVGWSRRGWCSDHDKNKAKPGEINCTSQETKLRLGAVEESSSAAEREPDEIDLDIAAQVYDRFDGWLFHGTAAGNISG